VVSRGERDSVRRVSIGDLVRIIGTGVAIIRTGLGWWWLKEEVSGRGTWEYEGEV
jgi:hypothetical protein